jgi:hypothetical protein
LCDVKEIQVISQPQLATAAILMVCERHNQSFNAKIPMSSFNPEPSATATIRAAGAINLWCRTSTVADGSGLN